MFNNIQEEKGTQTLVTENNSELSRALCIHFFGLRTKSYNPN